MAEISLPSFDDLRQWKILAVRQPLAAVIVGRGHDVPLSKPVDYRGPVLVYALKTPLSREVVFECCRHGVDAHAPFMGRGALYSGIVGYAYVVDAISLSDSPKKIAGCRYRALIMSGGSLPFFVIPDFRAAVRSLYPVPRELCWSRAESLFVWDKKRWVRRNQDRRDAALLGHARRRQRLAEDATKPI